MEDRLKDFEIAFYGLKLGEHQFDFELSAAFFEVYNYHDFEKSKLKAHVKMFKRETQLALELTLSGEVWVPCDISNEMFWLPLEAETSLMVKFGDDFDDSNEDLLILPHAAHYLNVAQFLYEIAVLARPLKVIHPEVAAGKKGQEALQKLVALSPEEPDVKDEKEDADPRWDKLKDLLN